MIPALIFSEKSMPQMRIELMTPGLQDQCSNHWATRAVKNFLSVLRSLLNIFFLFCMRPKNTCQFSHASYYIEKCTDKRMQERSVTMRQHRCIWIKSPWWCFSKIWGCRVRCVSKNFKSGYNLFMFYTFYWIFYLQAFGTFT